MSGVLVRKRRCIPWEWGGGSTMHHKDQKVFVYCLTIFVDWQFLRLSVVLTLSSPESSTRLKSLPMMSVLSSWSESEVKKKEGSSTFGPYILAMQNFISWTDKLTIINLPAGSIIVLFSVKLTFLFIRKDCASLSGVVTGWVHTRKLFCGEYSCLW